MRERASLSGLLILQETRQREYWEVLSLELIRTLSTFTAPTELTEQLYNEHLIEQS